MKKLRTDFTFTASTKKIIFTGPVSFSGILLITNITDATIIYNFADATKGGILLNNVLTLTYDTAAMSDSDVLQIWYDDGGENPVTNAQLRAANVRVEDQTVLEAIASSRREFDETGDERESLFDLFDGKNRDNIPIPMAPAGIDTPGQRPASQSLPVVIAPEQANDKFIQGFGLGAGYLGWNLLSPDPPITGQPWIDCSNFQSIFIQINTSGTVTGSIAFEGSNDGINASSVYVYDVNSPTVYPVYTFTLGTSTSRFWGAPIAFRYFRARISVVIAGGTVVAFTMLRRAPFSVTLPYVNASLNSISGYSIVNPGSTVSAPGLTAGGQDNLGAMAFVAGTTLTPPHYSIGSGISRRLLTDTFGNMGVTSPISPAGRQDQVGGPVIVAGPRVGYVGGQYAPIRVQLDQQQGGDTNIGDLLSRILGQLRVMNYYLKEMPEMIDRGRAFSDEPADILYSDDCVVAAHPF